MAQGFGLSLGIILLAVVIAVAITTWSAAPIAGSNSVGPIAPKEVIYRPQHLTVY